MIWGPLYNGTRYGGQPADSHASMMADATDMAVIRRQATHFVSLVKRSVKTKMNRSPFLEARMGPNMSTDRAVRGSVTRNSVKGVVFRRKARRFWAQIFALGDGG